MRQKNKSTIYELVYLPLNEILDSVTFGPTDKMRGFKLFRLQEMQENANNCDDYEIVSRKV